MCDRLFILFFGLVICSIAPSTAYARTPSVDNRDQKIDHRLNCFTSHASEKGVDWDDVCSNGSVPQGQEDLVAPEPDSMEEMIGRLHAAADEMLNESAGEERAARDIDDVYQKHDQVFDTKRTVDDVVVETGVKSSFVNANSSNLIKSAQVSEGASTNTDLSKEPSPKDVQKTEKKNTNKTHIPSLWDEPELMRDDAREMTQVQNRVHTFDLGYERYYYEYKEDSVDVKLKGWWDAVSAAYTYRPQKGDLLNTGWINNYRLEGRYGFADLDYSSGDTGTDDNIPNYMFETRALIGRDFFPVDRVVLTPYGGFGFRYLVDDHGGRQSTTGHWGYDRKSHYYYLPMGFDYTYQIDRGWRLVGNGEFDLFLWGWQKSYLGDVPFPGYFDVKNDQDHGYGVRGSIKFIKTTPLIDFSIEPFVRFWHIDDSDVANAGLFDGLEPENTTVESGIRAGVQF